jgi:chromosome segregation and condensation protein ScpB
MNELFLFVSEQANLLKRLCEVLGLSERASLNEIVRKLDTPAARGVLADG